MDFTPYRKAYFALCKSLGMDERMRHDFNRRMTNLESSSDWNAEHWRLVVAELQRLAGQDVQPGRPRIRGRHPASSIPHRGGSTLPPVASAGITPAQLEFIHTLADKITWRASLENFIRGRLLHPMRRDAWDGKLESLRAREAAAIITALKRMGRSDVAQSPSAAIRSGNPSAPLKEQP